jgi:hypothetical protein
MTVTYFFARKNFKKMPSINVLALQLGLNVFKGTIPQKIVKLRFRAKVDKYSRLFKTLKHTIFHTERLSV